MYVKNSLLALLDNCEIEYTLYQHEALSHAGAAPLPDMKGMVLKNLVLTNRTGKLFLFTLPITYKADLKALAKILDEPRFSFATKADLALMGIPAGHVSPFCLINDPSLTFTYVQPTELSQFALVNCHPLDNHFSVDISLEDLESFVESTNHDICRVTGAVIAP